MLHVTEDWLEAREKRLRERRPIPPLSGGLPHGPDRPHLAEDLIRQPCGLPPSPKGKASPPDCFPGARCHCGGEALSEEEEQILLFQWAGYMLGTMPELALLFHIPNGGYRSAAEAGRFKAMGVKTGVPDLFLPVPRGGYYGLFIELKRANGGALSDAQRDWLDDLNARGYKAVMCHGWEAARDVLIDYLRR